MDQTKCTSSVHLWSLKKIVLKPVGGGGVCSLSNSTPLISPTDKLILIVSFHIRQETIKKSCRETIYYYIRFKQKWSRSIEKSVGIQYWRIIDMPAKRHFKWRFAGGSIMASL